MKIIIVPGSRRTLLPWPFNPTDEPTIDFHNCNHSFHLISSFGYAKPYTVYGVSPLILPLEDPIYTIIDVFYIHHRVSIYHNEQHSQIIIFDVHRSEDEPFPQTPSELKKNMSSEVDDKFINALNHMDNIIIHCSPCHDNNADSYILEGTKDILTQFPTDIWSFYFDITDSFEHAFYEDEL